MVYTKKIFITGGCGFIGSNFIKLLLNETEYQIINYDMLTYAGNLNNLKEDEKNPKYFFIKGDICDKERVLKSLEGCDVLINFAAESHVDRSIKNASNFITTNILGTSILLDAAKELGIKKFIQISTDEVYGSLTKEDSSSKEEDILKPSSPYSSSKASAELLALSYYKTHKLPVIITRSSNNYGLYQYPEKLIPLFIINLINNKKVSLMGKGENIRDWIHVEDNCRGILNIIEKGKVGEIYNIGGENEKTNMEITKCILDEFNKDESWIKEIPHRLGHDFRYSLDCSKIKQLGWKPKYTFQEGMKKTIKWYRENPSWWKKLMEESK
ncbi:dTDP-glucose 4,6-dehydratase [Candidatus Woesearchaeota archaeon B3_Woes]|nr:MAG: dTDP-glucose 4,6-dehydratase [Candidatus Woesearchaeota archaeon B3_Woes]